MGHIEQLIREAARRVLPGLSAEEIRERLRRRKTRAFRRPPRAWCVAVRASDTRINAHSSNSRQAAIVPQDAMDASCAEHPGKVLAHTVVMDKRLLARLSAPVDVEYGTTIRELAKAVGVRPAGLHYRRCKGGSHRGQNGVKTGSIWGHFGVNFCALLRPFARFSPAKKPPQPQTHNQLTPKAPLKKARNTFLFPGKIRPSEIHRPRRTPRLNPQASSAIAAREAAAGSGISLRR